MQRDPLPDADTCIADSWQFCDGIIDIFRSWDTFLLHFKSAAGNRSLLEVRWTCGPPSITRDLRSFRAYKEGGGGARQFNSLFGGRKRIFPSPIKLSLRVQIRGWESEIACRFAYLHKYFIMCHLVLTIIEIFLPRVLIREWCDNWWCMVDVCLMFSLTIGWWLMFFVLRLKTCWFFGDDVDNVRIRRKCWYFVLPTPRNVSRPAGRGQAFHQMPYFSCLVLQSRGRNCLAYKTKIITILFTSDDCDAVC